jgi:hypothetical protein
MVSVIAERALAIETARNKTNIGSVMMNIANYFNKLSKNLSQHPILATAGMTLLLYLAIQAFSELGYFCVLLVPIEYLLTETFNHPTDFLSLDNTLQACADQWIYYIYLLIFAGWSYHLFKGNPKTPTKTIILFIVIVLGVVFLHFTALYHDYQVMLGNTKSTNQKLIADSILLLIALFGISSAGVLIYFGYRKPNYMLNLILHGYSFYLISLIPKDFFLLFLTPFAP